MKISLRQFLLSSVSACTLLCSSPIHSQGLTGVPARIQTVEGITEYRLANGMKVLLAPDLADDRVTVTATYMVGSRHEGNGETGMAHLLEHMIFKGTPTTPDPKNEFRKRGLNFNGSTSTDRTNYFATMASSQASLDWYLGWQADAMVNSFIARKDLDSEMSVVRNEFEIGENNGTRVLFQRMAHAAFPWHGYGRAIIGARSDIENVDIAQLQAFYRRYYRPDNMVLAVAGKFDLDQTLLAIQKTLGSLPRPSTPVLKTYTVDPAQDGERSVMVRRPATSQTLALSYVIPGALHPDKVPLYILATALGDAPSGRLHKLLVESKLASSTFAFSNSFREAGSFGMGAFFAPEDDAAPRQKLMVDLAENLAKDPIRQDEFDRAKAKANKTLELAFTNSATVAAGAIESEVNGDWRAVFVDRERIKTVTLDDVNRVARTYLLQSNRTMGHLIPTKDITRAPEPKLTDPVAYLNGFALDEKGMESVAFDYSPASLHQRVTFDKTPQGVQIAALQKPVRGDVLQASITFKFGNLDALKGLGAEASMANAMLTRGTTRLTRQQIEDEITRLGARRGGSLGEAGGRITLTSKKETFKPALDLLFHLLKDATFPVAEFEEVRSSRIKSLEGQIKDKAAQAESDWGRYGNPYPKSDPRYATTLEEQLAEYKAVTRDQAFAFYKRFYGAQNAQVRLLGPVDAKDYQQAVQALLDTWRAPEPWARVPDPLVEPKPARLVFETPDKANASVRAFHRIPIKALGMFEEFHALNVATSIFGGGPGSRLWTRLRETGGLSYSAQADLFASNYEINGTLSLNTEVAPQNVSQAEAALREELARSLAQGFTAAEVASFKQQILADRARGRSGDGWAMGFMANQQEFELDKDIFSKNDALIASYTPEQINAVWRKYVQPDKLVWGIFGDPAKMK